MGYFTGAFPQNYKPVQTPPAHAHPPGFNYTKMQNGVMNDGMEVTHAGEIQFWLDKGWWIDHEHHAKGVDNA